MTAHRPRLCLFLAIASTAALLLFSAPARADNITEWSENASRALFPAQGAIAFPHMAMVHAAMFDAVNAIDRRYKPYLVAPRAKPWFSQDAAAATAAYRVLVDGDVVAPDQRVALRTTLTPVYKTAIDAIDEGPARDGGIHVGEAAAWTMIASRSSDGRWGEQGFPLADPLMPGDWRPTPLSGLNDPGAWLRNVDPFFVRDPDRFLSGGPNRLRSHAYLREYNEVKAVGRSVRAVRTQDQTDAARFWGTVNAVSTWATLIRGLAGQRPLSGVDRARFYALIWLNGAYTAIATWRDKAEWMFWRPVTAIKLGDNDTNPKTVGDPSWEPLITTPPYPDHASGLSAAAGSITATARELFGTDHVTFSGTITPPLATPPTDPITRTYTRLSQARDEIVDALVWSGIHFRIADEDGAAIGRDVARWRRHHPILQPLRHHG